MNLFVYLNLQEKVNDQQYIDYNVEPEPKKSIDEIAKEVIEGKWGNGADRKKRLTNAGYDYAKVQARVNELLAPKVNY